MNNISLSFELICLMSWLLKNEKQGVYSLIKQAVKHGFTENLEKMASLEQQEFPEHLYTTVLDFLLFLEETLIKQLDEASTAHKEHKELIPLLKKIDADFNSTTLLASIRATKNRLIEQHKELSAAPSKHDVQKVLLETMLHNWSPDEGDSVN